MLKLSAVTKRFGSSIAVNGIDLDIDKGQIIGVIGRSGAGKSTLLRIINRLIDPSEGTIEFDGKRVSELRGRDLRLWRARCAMIFQQFNLVNRLDVLTNVLVGRVASSGTLPILFKQFSAEERTMAAKALDRLNLLPHALQRADTLSGGQQQRVAIARALVQMPDIVLADEPIASLDPHNARLVMEALKTINREDGITVICNLHTLDAARTYCTRIIGLAKGSVVFDGAPEALTNDILQRIYGEDGGAPVDERLTSGQFGRPQTHPVWTEPLATA
ncbi:phosphonate ABC transporter ATP-binding protein [Neorhizobium sp. P12A]|uniref:phosphonate ABC transporter ATP-binding protein n=1 Tax=Rhizobium/Agrobacterium group TaxID=227290 RepID=UPI001049F9A9|nr:MULTISPECIES: phosphonate ABC transporter ATP-binding protein [Rhizobium/Agrobacterium group]KAA0697369.1 phosphonate ABC transporter ATP-binding protein [Neorhizobium sp. P12A]TCR85816.1 phosphonate transport system ATP-binding protein [Rhizobium sp. BK376]